MRVKISGHDTLSSVTATDSAVKLKSRHCLKASVEGTFTLLVVNLFQGSSVAIKECSLLCLYLEPLNH